MSVRVTLNCQVKPEQFQALLPFLEHNLPNVRGFKGNLQVSVLYDEKNDEMLLDEEWLTIESHLAYLNFINNNGVLEKLSSFLSAPPNIKYFNKIEV
ncbi:antibiotic biosynthesis monooxygenase [Pseudoalteromonas maricaloris]|uniref:putative quinol monooxygenase n=1 Tax=Pseudoalteromonas maricaloris TaxID=184924 RepID=UPI0021ADFDA0|nr:antibiotic biosynthesis monooxygenase [Pseudoalteromonas flavipulchra]USE69630.1 antibiotic biosynthesis monooxygenase [Pseudoalteromonas flavipulchra]